MTPGRHSGFAGTLGDAPSHARAPVCGHRTESDRRRILVCDAESQSLRALRVVLQGAGFEVDAARRIAHEQVVPITGASTRTV
jgi:hypothetical protein